MSRKRRTTRAPSSRRQPVRSGGDAAAVPIRPQGYSRWRAGTLALVYLLFALHIAHWRLTGKTLAPLELNEVMYTLELGIVTAGFLFMTLAALSVVIFGRFFCSWGCHILALEDLCAWLLKKIGIRPKPVRSRVLLFVPPLAMFYMFIWPQVSRIMDGRPMPRWRVFSDEQGWASFVTTNFWRNLPGPWIIALSFAICGFAIVYFLGSRGFCTYGCPYGVLFGLFDRVAPGRIKLTGDCQQCGTCTANCQSHVRVHEELAVYGKVVSPACMKDLDCVTGCPHDALGYGFTRPALFQSLKSAGRRRIPYDFSFAEDILMALVFLGSLVIFRGLYGTVPFLLTLGLGGILAYLAVVNLRLIRSDRLRLNNFELKRDGRLTMRGRGFAAVSALLAVFVLHSGFIRYHERLGERALERLARASAGDASATAEAKTALAHFAACEQWGLFKHPLLEQRFATLYESLGEFDRAASYLQSVLEQSPGDLHSRVALARILVRLGRPAEAAGWLEQVARAEAAPGESAEQVAHLRGAAHALLGEIARSGGDATRAKREYQAALSDAPDNAAACMGLGELLADEGRFSEAEASFRRVLSLKPDAAEAQYNLGVMLAAQGRGDEAVEAYRAAIRLNPNDADVENNLGFLLAKQGKRGKAATHFRRALEVDAKHAHAHFNLARLLQESGDTTQALSHFQSAARLDPQYARLLGISAQSPAAARPPAEQP